MTVYLDVVLLLNFLVDFLLLLGTNRLMGHPLEPGKCALGALLGSVYAGACMLPRLRFLGSWLWRLVSLGAMGCLAYGLTHSALRRSLVFAFLSLALGGLMLCLGGGGFFTLGAAAAGLCLLCMVCFGGKLGSQTLVPVELTYGDRMLHLTALLDTGNTLKDPLTGRPVLVVNAQAAEKLTGLTREQLRRPVESMGTIPGLRLIPYEAVGQSGGMLLGLRLAQVRIGKWTGSGLVAFAPEGLSGRDGYQALTGGMV